MSELISPEWVAAPLGQAWLRFIIELLSAYSAERVGDLPDEVLDALNGMTKAIVWVDDAA